MNDQEFSEFTDLILASAGVEKPSAISLKPCPFCGGKAGFDHDDNGWNWIECSQCHVSSKAGTHAMDDCRPMLAEAWNKRVETPLDKAKEVLLRTHDRLDEVFSRPGGPKWIESRDMIGRQLVLVTDDIRSALKSFGV